MKRRAKLLLKTFSGTPAYLKLIWICGIKCAVFVHSKSEGENRLQRFKLGVYQVITPLIVVFYVQATLTGSFYQV